MDSASPPAGFDSETESARFDPVAERVGPGRANHHRVGLGLHHGLIGVEKANGLVRFTSGIVLVASALAGCDVAVGVFSRKTVAPPVACVPTAGFGVLNASNGLASLMIFVTSAVVTSRRVNCVPTGAEVLAAVDFGVAGFGVGGVWRGEVCATGGVGGIMMILLGAIRSSELESGAEPNLIRIGGFKRLRVDVSEERRMRIPEGVGSALLLAIDPFLITIGFASDTAGGFSNRGGSSELIQISSLGGSFSGSFALVNRIVVPERLTVGGDEEV